MATDMTACLDTDDGIRTRPGTYLIATTMFVAPLLLAVAELLSPINTSSDTTEEWYADVLGNPGRYAATALLLLAGLLLMVPAVLTVRRAIPAATRSTATVGAAIAAAGLMLWAVNLGAVGIGVSAWTSLSDSQQTDALPAFVAMDEGEGLMPIVQLGAVLPVIGLIVLATALWRNGAYPRLATVALPAGFAVLLFTPINVGRAAGALVLLAGFVPAVTNVLHRDERPAS